MKPQIENLGKVSVTVEQQPWTKNSQYERLTIVEDIDSIASYISRKDVPAGIDITNREYWIPLGKVSDYLENFVEEERRLLIYLEQSVRNALEANQEFHDTAWEEVQSQVNQLNEIIATAINTINSTNTTFNSNEVDRATAENKRVIAENERVTQENERNAAEALRRDAETNREAAEEERQRKYTNEYDAYENNRRNAEILRNAAESARQEQEAYRISNEERRQNAESIRQGSENVRNSSETSRQQGEEARVTAENARAIAEINRQLQEGTYADKPDTNGSRWARFHQAETERTAIAQEEENTRNATFTNAETERQNSFAEAEARRDKKIEDAVAILNTYETKLNNKANVDGSYSSMTVGAAETLLGNNIVTAKYTYRPTADTTDVADGVAKISSVKGNTIVWHQRFKDAEVPIDSNGVSVERLNGVISLNGTTTTSYISINEPVYHNNESNIPLNHIGYYKCTIVKDLNNILQNKAFILHNRNAHITVIGSTVSFIYKNINDSLGWGFGFTDFTKGDVLEDVQIKVNIFDLTRMFGAGNEPTIEEFEAMFPNDYYEYNEGELRSIEDFSIKSVGFNQWDEEVINGYYRSTDGVYVYNSAQLCSKNPIKVMPNGVYHLTALLSTYIQGFDKNMNYIGTLVYSRDIKITIPDNVSWIHIGIIPDYGTIYNNDICINLSHSGIRNGEYEPYQEDILPISISTIKDENGEVLFPNGLCSAGTAHDELVYDKGIDKWKAIKRIGSVDLGTLEWYTGWYADTGRVYANLISKALGRKNIIYPLGITADDDNRLTDSVGICGNTSNTFIFIGQGATHTDSAAFIASLNGIYAYYELAEPIEVILDDFTSNYKVSDWGTEEILMNTTPIVPVTYNVEYGLNAVDTLRNLPTNYISKESIDAFLGALGSAMGGTWSATYNETNGRYDFTFSANASSTELIEE